jgi:hypothetical protein
MGELHLWWGLPDVAAGWSPAARLALVITFPDADTRDTVLATRMTDGMETSYARLETQVLT